MLLEDSLTARLHAHRNSDTTGIFQLVQQGAVMCRRVRVTPKWQTNFIAVTGQKIIQPSRVHSEDIVVKHHLFNGQIFFSPLEFIQNEVNRFTPQGIFSPEHILILTFDTKVAGKGTAPLSHDGVGSGLFGVIIPLYRIFVDVDSTLNSPIGHGQIIQLHERTIFIFNDFIALPAPGALDVRVVLPCIQTVRQFDNNGFTFINAEYFGKSYAFLGLKSWPGATPNIGYIKVLSQPLIEFTGNADQS